MTSLFECDLENERLAEMGIIFVCPKRSCPLSYTCPYTQRVIIKEREEGDVE